jgi:5-methylcytosine-specific restriction endonuclease McrA
MRVVLTWFLNLIASLAGSIATAASRSARPAVKRSSQWPKVRAAHLKLYPECAACGSTRDLEVHHEWPFGWPGGDKLELSPANMVTLCESSGGNHHLWVGHLGNFQSRNPDVRADAATMLAKVRSRPCPAET